MIQRISLSLAFAMGAGIVVLFWLGTSISKSQQQTPGHAPQAELPATPVSPKPLTDNVKKGLAYLINQQHDDGGWGQGGGWRQGEQGGRVEGANVADPSDLGNTCIAVLALLRAGHTPTDGEYAKNVAKGVAFILAKIEKADQESLYVTDDRGAQYCADSAQYSRL